LAPLNLNIMEGGVPMKIDIQSMKRCLLVKVSGQIDSSSAPQLEQELLGLVDAGHKHLVVNMRDVDFVSSAGMKALLAAQIRLRKALPPGEVAITELSPRLKDTFQLVGLHLLFKYFENDVEAVGSF
jgi:anti-sigma B factor antagonist